MIFIESVFKTFGSGQADAVCALDNVSLTIDAHEFVIIIGTNGSGKSTLLNAIAGTVALDRGRIVVGETTVTSLHAYERARYIGRVFQNPFSGTAPHMTIAENLRLASLRGVRKRLHTGLTRRNRQSLRDRCAELRMGLEDRMDTPIGLLSGGQRQALTLLMATLREPDILLLDEHTAALDPGSAQRVLSLTAALVAQQRLTTIMVTHDMAEAVQVGTRLVMMDRGSVVRDVTGPEKERLTGQDLLQSFVSLGHKRI
jgi:putative tryptophan/tyrosine transport system ATP-binding protein